MSRQVTLNFHAAEFDCRSGTPYPLDQPDLEAGGLLTWFDTRLLPLCQTLEVIRSELNGREIHINSGYRTLAYDQALYDKSAKDGSVATPQGSMHPRGKAADIVVAGITPAGVHAAVLMLYQAGKLPQLGGLGAYPSFSHIDIRARGPNNHLAQWAAMRTSNIV